MANDNLALGQGSGFSVQISQDWYQRGSGKRSPYFRQECSDNRTRAEKMEDVIHHFPRVYKEETGKEVSSDAEGIVVLQFGHYPYDRDIEINPDDKRCLTAAVGVANKVLQMDYVFESHTLWLEKGSKKPIHLLDAQTVLIDDSANNVAEFIAKKIGCETPMDMGVQRIELRKGFKHPYRVYRTADARYILMNLLNGVVSVVEGRKLPLTEELAEKFSVGTLYFEKESKCWRKF